MVVRGEDEPYGVADSAGSGCAWRYEMWPAGMVARMRPEPVHSTSFAIGHGKITATSSGSRAVVVRMPVTSHIRRSTNGSINAGRAHAWRAQPIGRSITRGRLSTQYGWDRAHHPIAIRDISEPDAGE